MELKFARVKPSREVLVQTADDEALMLDLRSEQYFGLNAVGTRLWQLVQEVSDTSAIRRRLLDEFDVAEEQLTQDMNAIFDELLEAGLIETDPRP